MEPNPKQNTPQQQESFPVQVVCNLCESRRFQLVQINPKPLTLELLCLTCGGIFLLLLDGTLEPFTKDIITKPAPGKPAPGYTG